MEVEWKSDESPTDIGWAELSRHCCDGKWRHCTTAPNNATLRRGRQRLQLAVTMMADSAATCGATATMATTRCSPSQRYAVVFLFFFFYSTTSRKKKNGRKREVLKPTL